MSNPIYISVPGGFTRTQEIIALADEIRKLDDRIVIQAYDTAQGLQWNGGRLIINQRAAHLSSHRKVYDVSTENLHEAVNRVRLLNEHGIPFNLTLNNVLENLDTEDEDGNYLLRHLENDMNWVTVATRALTQHVRSEYPKFKICASICFVWHDLEACKRACQTYDLVVMLPEFAYQDEALAQLPVDKLSFILNDDCYLYCRRKEHYQALSRSSLSGNLTRSEQEMNIQIGACLCQNQKGYRRLLPDGVSPDEAKRVTRIAVDQQYLDGEQVPGGHEFNITRATRRKLFQRGVNHFKLQGRAIPDELYRKVVSGFLEAVVREEL